MKKVMASFAFLFCLSGSALMAQQPGNFNPSKMKERLENAKNAYASLMKFNGDTKFKSKADEMLTRIENDLKQYSK